MTPGELEAHYRDYISCLNERRLDRMNEFYADELLYNGRRLTRAQWLAQAIDATFDAMPDFQWHIEHLVVDESHVAARLLDTGTPQNAWSDLPPNPRKRTARFGEHVFYSFRDGLADEVWSIADIEAIRTQITQ